MESVNDLAETAEVDAGAMDGGTAQFQKVHLTP